MSQVSRVVSAGHGVLTPCPDDVRFQATNGYNRGNEMILRYRAESMIKNMSTIYLR
jgi:hypothetical protein